MDGRGRLEIKEREVEALDEAIARDYFEIHGWLTRRTRRSREAGRKKVGGEIVLALHNPSIEANGSNLNFLLFSTDLVRIRSALLAVVGWGVPGFSPASMRSGNAMLKFLKAEVIGKLDDWFEVAPGNSEEGMGPLLRLICLPGLPGTEKMRQPVVDLLQSAGIDGAFTMRAMLEHLLRRAEETSDYRGSLPLQFLRMLKVYEVVRDPQMDFFD
ncbi:MAG: hypothetical protein VCA36_12510 [Opitutales bacterium]